jgi:hypothetical protein
MRRILIALLVPITLTTSGCTILGAAVGYASASPQKSAKHDPQNSDSSKFLGGVIGGAVGVTLDILVLGSMLGGSSTPPGKDQFVN